MDPSKVVVPERTGSSTCISTPDQANTERWVISDYFGERFGLPYGSGARQRSSRYAALVMMNTPKALVHRGATVLAAQTGHRTSLEKLRQEGNLSLPEKSSGSRPCAPAPSGHARYTRATMFRSISHRLTTTLVVVLSLLFSQLALANYVCPVQADANAMASQMASGQPCEGMDKAQPALCHEHGADASQSFETVKVPTPTLPMLVQVLELPLVLDADEASAAPTAATRKPQSPPDPLYLATLRLRV